jgi:predicted ATPase
MYAQAESRFLRAIDIAQRQGAKSLELRAVTSLSQLWQTQGRTQEARRRLGETCAWFREGFATADHKRARAVLDDLT